MTSLTATLFANYYPVSNESAIETVPENITNFVSDATGQGTPTRHGQIVIHSSLAVANMAAPRYQ